MKPPKIKHAYIDGDLAVFPCASAGQRIEYYFVDEHGNEFGSFDSAQKASNWLFELEAFGADSYFGYEGEPSGLVRHSRIHIKDFEECTKAYDSLIKKWVKATGASSYTVYLSKKAGLENFRHSVALRKPYKGNRSNSEKPYYLDELRKYALSLPNHKVATGDVECDDVVVGMSVRKPSNVLIQNEKDGLQTVGCWVYHPDVMKKPVFSRPDTVGWIKVEGDKILGLGHLFLLSQCTLGDNCDNYQGLEKCGVKGTFKALSPFNKEPIERLDEAVSAVCELYYKKYGLVHEYTNKDGEVAVGSWKDFLLESLNLAYMRKSRKDVVPQPYTDMINEWEKNNVEELNQ